jgi:hypothetical protein
MAPDILLIRRTMEMLSMNEDDHFQGYATRNWEMRNQSIFQGLGWRSVVLGESS